MDFIRDFIDPGLFVSHLVNFLILFFIFKHFLGDHLVKMIHDRRAMMEKANNAEAVYEEKMQEAEAAKQVLIDEAVAHKNKLVEEATMTATQKADAIVEKAEKQASTIAKTAQEKATKLSSELENNFVDGVKQTAHMVVKKLFAKDVDLKEKYIDELVQEFAK